MAPSTWHKVTDPAMFYEKSLPFLMQEEGFYNLPLGIAERLSSNPSVFGDQVYLFLRTDGVDFSSPVRGVIWWTLPYPLGFSNLSSDDVKSFFKTQKLPAVPNALVGPAETLGVFTEYLGAPWTGFPRGFNIQNQGIYALSSITNAFKDVPGEARYATENDFDLVLSWSERFIIDCKTTRSEKFEASVRKDLQNKSRVLWMLDEDLVSMAGTAGQTPNGSRIAWVYTPPELRGRGFGGAVTRFLTEEQLKKGKKFCFLYTDMSNPTSNSIYKKIGYEWIGSSQYVSAESS